MLGLGPSGRAFKSHLLDKFMFNQSKSQIMFTMKIIKVFITLIVMIAMAMVYAAVLNDVFSLIASFCTGSYFGFRLEEDLFGEDNDIYI